MLELLNSFLMNIKHLLASIGALVILTGALFAAAKFAHEMYFRKKSEKQSLNFDTIRLDLGRSIILGLEFIIAADVIETTTTPDYYALGILGLLVVIRTFLNFSLNRDITNLSQLERKNADMKQT